MAKTILVAANSEIMRQLLSFALKDAGYDVIETVNGKDAMDRLNGAKIEMVIIDLDMTGAEGIELIRQIRSRPGYKFVPVIMLTAASDESQKREGRLAGASGWIVKPFLPKQLTDVVKRFVK